jgi:hypothetical protein
VVRRSSTAWYLEWGIDAGMVRSLVVMPGRVGVLGVLRILGVESRTVMCSLSTSQYGIVWYPNAACSCEVRLSSECVEVIGGRCCREKV